jgi:anthranilate phosphoribosyltransferase
VNETETDDGLMREVLQRIATGPEYSKDLGRDATARAMALVLEGRADPVQAGVFLIALRMKRETDDEYLGILDALRAATRTATAPVPALVDVSDPYDGFVKSLPASPFLPAVLAACGLPAVSHGVARLGPKHGVTHAAVLAAAGAAVDLDPARAAARIADPSIGWAYVDQSRYCPALHALVDLRERIVKRPTLSTVERVLAPVRAAGATHLLAGYVHKAYPEVYALLARAAGLDSALLVRGVEGGVTPGLRQAGRALRLMPGTADAFVDIDPVALGIDSAVRAPAPAGGVVDAAGAALAGLAALDGAKGATRDALVVTAALALWLAGKTPGPVDGAELARAALDSGAARARFRAGARPSPAPTMSPGVGR